MIDLRQSDNYAQFMKRRGWIVEKINPDIRLNNKAAIQSPSFVYAYIKRLPLIRRSVMKIQRFSLIPEYDELIRIAKKYKVFYLTFEFDNSAEQLVKLRNFFQGKGFKSGNSPFLPTKTIRINLEENPERILVKMKYSVRWTIKKGVKNCKTFIVYDDKAELHRFYNAWVECGKGNVLSKNEFFSLLRCFGKNAFLVSCQRKNEVVAGIITLINDGCAYYAYAFTTVEGRKIYAGYAAVWKLLEEARKHNCKTFDFEGIYDERFTQLKRWGGFTKFKRKFGGSELSYDKPYTKFIWMNLF